MRVKALRSFAGTAPSGSKYRVVEGEEFDLPEGVDWLNAGLVKVVEPGQPVKETKRGKKASGS